MRLEELALIAQGAFAGFAVLNAFWWRDLEPNLEPSSYKRLSVLIPARNEARNLETLLPSLLESPLHNLEILVLNDRSSDGTAAVVQRFADSDARVRLLEGLDLPAGWLGKTWACHQLSQAATGDALIFTDADTRWDKGAPGAIARQLEGCDALCAWPRQAIADPISRLIQPLQQWSLIAFLPLLFVPARAFTVAVAANGQCLVFTRPCYDAIGGHEAVKRDVLEDMALSRAVKRAGLKFALLNGANAITTRMYSSADEAFNGYAKNVYPAFGGTVPAFAVAAAFNIALGVAPLAWLLTAWTPEALICVLLSFVARAISDWRCGYDLRFTALHPLGLLVWLWIGAVSMQRFKAGKVSWKGRSYDLR